MDCSVCDTILSPWPTPANINREESPPNPSAISAPLHVRIVVSERGERPLLLRSVQQSERVCPAARASGFVRRLQSAFFSSSVEFRSECVAHAWEVSVVLVPLSLSWPECHSTDDTDNVTNLVPPFLESDRDEQQQ